MRPLIIFYDEFYNKVYYLHKNENLIDTTTIYCMSKSEFLSTFKVSDVENWYQKVDINLQQQVLLQILKNLDDNHIGLKSYWVLINLIIISLLILILNMEVIVELNKN